MTEECGKELKDAYGYLDFVLFTIRTDASGESLGWVLQKMNGKK